MASGEIDRLGVGRASVWQRNGIGKGSILGRGIATSARRLPLLRDLYPSRDEGGYGSGLSVRPARAKIAGQVVRTAALIVSDPAARFTTITGGVAQPIVAAQSRVMFSHGALWSVDMGDISSHSSPVDAICEAPPVIGTAANAAG
jgi:hypothetical protein